MPSKAWEAKRYNAPSRDHSMAQRRRGETQIPPSQGLEHRFIEQGKFKWFIPKMIKAEYSGDRIARQLERG